MPYGQNVQTPNFSNAVGQTPAERWRFSTLNDMLLAIDLAGIDYNDSITDTMEGQHALRVFTDVMYEVESEGWEFNTIESVDITLDDEGRYAFDYETQSYVFSLVGSDDDLFVSMDGSIKTRSNGLDDPTVLGDPGNTITLTNVIVERWADMHFALTQYVAALAVNRYQALMIGDTTAAKFAADDVQRMYVNARRDEIRSGKYNILTSNFGTQVNR